MFFVCLFTVLPLPTRLAHADAFMDAGITANGVCLREKPDDAAKIILKLNKGSRIGVMNEAENGWYRVVYGDYTGYVKEIYVFLPSRDTMQASVLTAGTVIRQNPGAFSDSIGNLKAGETVTVVDISGEWYEIQTQNKITGYVRIKDIGNRKAEETPKTLRQGMSGDAVVKMQNELKERGFFFANISGYYGDLTREAIANFQLKAGMQSNGIADAATLAALYGKNNIRITPLQRAGITGKVLLTPWIKMNDILKKGMCFTITDVDTGLSWKAIRFGGWWHADCEPATKADTAIYKKVYGGRWSWVRRAVWVTIGNNTYAASIHGMPHMVDVIPGNDFPGHMCVHFWHSKVHENGRECPRHHAMILKAYRIGNNLK